MKIKKIVKMTAEGEFIEFFSDISRKDGMDELSSKIIGVLFIEPEEISLDEIAEKTGYSLAAVSTTMKNLGNFPFIRRFKKPKSKKIFFYMEKDMLKMFKRSFQMRYEAVMPLIKEKLPRIIEKFKPKNQNDKKKLDIIENYYRHALKSEKIFNEILKMLDET